jgi:hypothetical protein
MTVLDWLARFLRLPKCKEALEWFLIRKAIDHVFGDRARELWILPLERKPKEGELICSQGTYCGVYLPGGHLGVAGHIDSAVYVPEGKNYPPRKKRRQKSSADIQEIERLIADITEETRHWKSEEGP